MVPAVDPNHHRANRHQPRILRHRFLSALFRNRVLFVELNTAEVDPSRSGTKSSSAKMLQRKNGKHSENQTFFS
jgi:hypothetical protein